MQQNQDINIIKAQKPNITLTANALIHLKKMLAKKYGIGMRLFLKKAGCSGYMYKVELIEETSKDDVVFSLKDNLILAVPQKWLPFLNGTQIDYIQEGLNHQFHFVNPNEADSCGCGESFSIVEDDEPLQ